METIYLNEHTWYYDQDGRIWLVLAVLKKDPLNQKVWLIESGINEAKEHPFHKVEALILKGTLKPYVKPKI